MSQLTNVINLSALMDAKTSNESMDLNPDETGLMFVYLQNQDLFYTNALSTRQGVRTVSNGIINAPNPNTILYDTYNNLPSGTVEVELNQIPAPLYYDYEGQIIIPSGDTNIYKGNIILRQISTSGTTPSTATLKMRLHQINAVRIGESTISGVSSNPVVNAIWDIGLSGVTNTPPFPQYIPNQGTTLTVVLPNPVAVSDPVALDLGAFTFSGSQYYTDWVNVPFTFTAPFPLASGSVYFLQNYITLNPENGNGNYQIKGITHDSVDISPNTSYGQEFYYFGLPQNQANAIRSFGGNNKAWINQEVFNYASPNYMLIDNPTASYMQGAPILSGNLASLGIPDYPEASLPVTIPAFNPLLSTPSISTKTVEFGQVINIPSGQHTIYGSYFYANTFLSGVTANPTPTEVPIYTRNRQRVAASGYNAGYAGYLSEITASGGTMASGDYVITGRTPVAVFSGNYIFSEPIDVNTSLVDTYNSNLDKLYCLYNNPVQVTGPKDMLLSFRFYDFQTGNDMTDYGYTTASVAIPRGFYFSPFKIGMENNLYSGTYVYNKNGDGNTFQQNNVNGSGTGNYYDLSCGVISVASGNAITSIFDYTVLNNKKLIFTQTDKLYYSNPNDIANTKVVLFSGAEIDNRNLWSHEVSNNLLFSHQYSKIDGQYWNSVYIDPSGNSTQQHGLRPVFEASGTTISGSFIPSGVPTLPHSGVVSIVMATPLISGGFRSSVIKDFDLATLASGQNAIGLYGTDIFNPSGASQYKFDVLDEGSYIFQTISVSGDTNSVYYLSQLYDSVTGAEIIQPLPNVGTFGNAVILNASLAPSGTLSQQVAEAIDYSQNYLILQTDVPRFKKIINYKNKLIGVGASGATSTAYYSETLAPNIFGLTTDEFGIFDIAFDNGQDVTAIEVFQDYLFIFKNNSTFRYQYTGQPGNPFEPFQISTNIGNLGFFSTSVTEGGIVGLSQYGPTITSIGGVQTIGAEIYPYFQTLDNEDLIYSYTIHDIARTTIYNSISSSNINPSNQTALVYYYPAKAWGIRKSGLWNCAGKVGDIDNFTRIFIGDTLGQIKQLNSSQQTDDVLFTDVDGVDLTRNIELSAETPWLNFGNSQTMKQIKFLRINCNSSQQTLRVDVCFDQDDTVRYTRYLNMSAPVINRLVSLASTCRTVKFIFTTVGNPDKVQINSLQIGFIDRGYVSGVR